MDEQQRNDLRRQILDRIRALDGMLSAAEADQDDESGDESASLDQKISSVVTSQITENEKLELRLLRSSLQWLDSDDAGYCRQCGCEIPFARLQAVPVTQICVQCAEQKW